MRATRKRDKYCTEEQMKKTFLQSIRTIATLLFLLVGNLLQQMWAADVKYYIINNQGKVCFQYVIKDGFTYTSINKSELCVHPWARSMVATGFRFYTNIEDARADAAGTIGAHFEEGEPINSETTGTGPFYVRYRMKTQQELEEEGFTYDPDGRMTYFMQIRERNAKGGKRRQVYFDAETNDKRFEFGSPGGSEADIPYSEEGGDGYLQIDVPYRFRFDTKGDAYGVYIYNGAGEGLNPNGVLTVKEVGRNNDNKVKQKEKVVYEDIISNYDPGTSTTLQTFFFVAANEHILNSSWNAQWSKKVFIVGALGGLDYVMRDNSNVPTGNDEANMPYMLCAMGATGNFSDPGYQLQCYRSWRNYDPSNGNTALILTTPYEETHQVTYHIVNSANTSKDVLTIVQRHGPNSPFNLSNRTKLQRLGCTLSTDYFSDRECTTPASAKVGDATDVYVPYTFDAAGTTTATNLVFSTKENPKWFSLTIRESGTKKLVYDATNNVINSSLPPDAETLALQTAQYAFIGDPYSFQIICKSADGKYAYVNPETLAYNNQKNNVCFTDSPTDNLDKFAMVGGTTSSSFQIFSRDAYAQTKRAFWDARGGGNQIWMYTQTGTNEIAASSNLHATPTPEYNYTYNIVDNSGHIAIKYTVRQEVAHRLDGEHGHKAIPSAIYSPYLEGETLTFYTTFGTPGDLATLSGETDKLPAGGVDPTNIYVRYTTALLSSRRYPLNGTKEYVMQIGDRYAIYTGSLTTQDTRPTLEDANIKKKVWVLLNADPYNVQIENTLGSFFIWDGSDIHFILMDGKSAEQVELLFASGADISPYAPTPSTCYSLTLSETSIIKSETTRKNPDNDYQQIIFNEASLDRTYRIIDKQGKILIEYNSEELGEGKSGELGVPEKWRSPLIQYTANANCGYKYWVISNFNVSGDTYTLKNAQTPIDAPAKSNDGYIYVTYDAITDVNDENYVDMNSSVTDIDERVRRSATSANMERDASKFGQLYMLKFTSSADYNLEDGGDKRDDIVTPSGTKVYPYTNGDGPLYVYTQARWDSQKDGGASTRTRWPWYILSPNNDPYHVMVTSWQSTHSKSETLTSYYGYLRTYYNTEIKQIITGNISDDPRTVDEEGNRIMPTEYMLLGTKDQYKLVTSEVIGNDDNGYESTNHRTVTSFEQYWRNNPAVHRTLGLADGSGPITPAQEETLKSTYGWHKYKAWVNAAAWSGSTSASNKSYAYDDHWFMTVNVGSGEFELVPAEIDAVLVLVDNHGWEIMRQPIPKHSETARYEAAKTVLRKWDSPMVKQYKFYGTRYVTHKVNGYHKYNIYDNYDKSDGKWLKSSDLVNTGASLADYPEKYSGSALYDLYVTYTVKPEYAQAYTGAATAGATVVNSEFLIRQDGKLAKADNATTLNTIESSSTGIDSGTDTGLSDQSLYWYLKPNFDIDKEMGYLYDVREEASDPTSHLYTEAETNERYNAEGASGFDPYNIQIYNKRHTGGYFTTNATAADIVHGQYIATTAPAGDGTVTLSSKTGTEGVFSSKITAYDSKTLKITNQTFMAVQDANGNMRLMPRFDQAHVIENFTALKDQAVAQPVDDKAHGQTTWLLRPIVYTYYVIDNQGREALQYKLMSDGAPKIPAIFKSPFAKDFTYYKNLTLTEGIYTEIANGADISAKQITGSFADAGLSGGNVYVRYNYNPDADIDALLKGMWYNAKLNGSDVKVTAGGIAKETYAADAAHRWRFMQSAGSDSDPYAVTLWNGTPATESSNQRYILMGHSDGTGYALMQAANASTTDYYFLDGTSAPAFAAQSGYTTDGTIDATKKLTLTPVLATDNVTYKIITHSGKVALTSEEVAVTESSLLDLPEWMESPLMKSDAYIYYSAADVVGSVYTPKGEPTTSPKTLDGSVVYVRYDYEKSKKAVESFGIEKEDAYKDEYEKLPYNYAPLDLSGKVAYTMGTTSTGQYLGKLWSVNTSTHAITQTNVAVNTELTKEARLWYFTGNDPYEVTIKNPAYSATAVLAGKTPDPNASDTSTPNNKYPLVQMVEPNDGTYTLNTFMVLKYNPKENVTGKINNIEHCAGSLKLYVTGNDTQYLAESNSMAGGVYIYTDTDPSTGNLIHYKERLAASGEPLNPKNNPATMIIYSSFVYRPVLTYHIITNNKKEALTGYSLMSGTTAEMPEMYQSPLLNSGDFTYYTAATEDAGTWTVTESSKIASTTTIADLVTSNKGDIYVRYTYGASPFKIATNIDDDAEDNTHLSWIDEKVLDLSGKTFYTIADMQHNFSSDHGRVFGVKTDNKSTFKQKIVKDLPNGRAPSSKEYLWQLEGGDPYAVKIKNANYNEYLSVSSSNRQQSIQPDGTAGYLQTFMILEAHATDNGINRYAKDESGETLYQLQRWTVMIPTGTKQLVRLTKGNDEFVSLDASNTWEPTNYSDYNIRMSSSEVVTRRIFNMGGGNTADYCVEFIKAPVTRKYHYHAIKFDSEGNEVGETWNAILEHDWRQPVVIEDVIARQFCKYETKGTVSGDNVTPSNVFETRWTLNQEAQFYHDAAFTERVKDNVIPGASQQYDVYPEIALEDIYDIYFKYQIDNTATLKERKLSDITSTPEQIAADAAYYNDPNGGNGRMGVGYTQQAKWFFMVLDTDADITATGEGDSRTFTGRQMFLRREDDGTVNWMNNAYALHKYPEDNYNNWSYSRIAEWYQKGDNDAYREGRWLWTFVGDDPYNMRIINFESAAGVTAEGYNVYTLAGAENCYTTITRGATADTYPVTIPTSEPTENQYWGICVGVANSKEETFSLLSTSITNSVDGKTVNEPLYWHMVSRTANKVTTESVEGLLDYVPDQSYAIQLLPYEPVKYQDINLVIKRDDHVADYITWKAANPSATPDQKRAKLKTYDSGISLLYFTANERTYVAGDEIDLDKDFSLPINVRRAFCDYTLYSDDYVNPGGKYTVADGPYPTTIQATTTGTWTETSPGVWEYIPGTGDLVYDENGKPVWVYTSDGTSSGTPAAGAQSIYAKYVVNSDIFLKTAPNKTQVEAMVANNDHVYFMDFPTLDSKGKEITHHAFYDPEATTRIQTGDLSKNKDKNTGQWTPEKKSWNGSAYVSDMTNSYNAVQYRTADDRLVSTPEKLKWYFVGDPYKVQVFSTAGLWNAASMTDPNSHVWAADTKGAQLARFNAVETNFQFVSDCVHIRLPDYTKIDNREKLIPTNEYGVLMPEQEFPNRNNGKPYINDFYWEVVPTATDKEGTFALRFKEDNELLGYRNVYYYLARDGLTKTYRSSAETPEVYHINMSYNANNECYESGKYLGYHKANNEYTAIKLVQPVKVYITTHRDADSRYSDQNNVTIDEYSGYYGLNETITGIPRHLMRKFVKYADLTDKYGTTTGEHVLSEANAYNSPLDNCTAHSGNVFQTGTKINPIFKFSVHYTVDDLTSEGVHLFSTAANINAPTVDERNNITWLDMKISNSSWPYYDKTNLDGSGVENKTYFVSNYRRAMYEPKNTGWSSTADGWNDGLKGLHWAFIGDPYDFTILNRRRYEDVGDGSGPKWLAATKNTIADYQSSVPKDSIVWTSTLVNAPTDTNTSTATAALADNDINTHWSLQMWKLGGNNDFFLRTASLDQTAYNAAEADAQADNYWRMAARTTTIGGNPYEFEAIPYSLDNKNKWTSNIGDLNYTSYIVNNVGYSQTSSGMGVTEQLLQLRTATSKDNDKADNNCFDAKIEIRTKKGDLRISKDRMEVKFGIAADMLPYSMRRYGCTYECYINYVDAEHPGKLLYRLRDSNVPMDESESWATSTEEYDALNAAVAAAKAAGQNVTLTFVYDMTEEAATYFTTEQSALIDEYTWMNTFFEWEQYYSGTNVEVEYYEDVFDHYVYNAQGQIVDAVYIKVRKTKIVKNPTEPYITDAYLNSHTTNTAIYADQSVQSEKDQQKWALVGDPYSFTMTNYDQYLKNQNSKLTLEGTNVVASNISKQNFTLAIDTEGKTFLGIFDGTGEDGNANITHCINFDYSTSSDKSLHYESTAVINTNDPTGNTLNTKNIKPFKLADLISYADVIQYHLVLAHQYTLEPKEEHLKDIGNPDNTYTEEQQKQRQTLRSHMIEYLKYQGIRYHNDSTYYVNYGATPITYSTTHSDVDALSTMIKQHGTLRDFITYPVDDYHISRIGIGNHPQVPWYMKRQFCKYYLYQRDVQRSKVSDRPAYLKNENGEYVDYEGNVVDEGDRIPLWINEEEGIRAYEIDWVSIFDISGWSEWKTGDGEDAKHVVTDDDVTKWGGGLEAGTFRKIPSGYAEATELQGKEITTLKDCHKNRKVIVDVVFDVNTNEFNFATLGRNTYAWYQMMTNNASSGLMNFSYKDGIGARTDATEHYTNNYLWAPEGDPYGFVLHSRYANNNGTGWNDVVVTTTGALPKKSNYKEYTPGDATGYEASYTGSGNKYDNKEIIHTTDGVANAVYEMFTGTNTNNNSFLMHPTSAYIDHSNIDFNSYYMIHDTGDNKAKLVSRAGRLLKTENDANWRLATTPEQLWPYFEHAGYVGGLDPVKAQNFSNLELRTQIKEYLDNPSIEREYSVLNKARQLVYSGQFYRNGETIPMAATDPRPTDPAKLPLRFVADNLVPMTAGYYRIQGYSTEKLKAAETASGVYGPRYVSGYRFASEVDNTKPLHYFETDQVSTTKHTFSALTGFTDGTLRTLRDNIELLPAEYDASSIFQFKAAGDEFNRWTFGSQDLNVLVVGTPAVGTPATTKMSSADGTKFYLDDIGGATVTLRTLINNDNGPSNADSDHNWESDANYGVTKNIQTNYLTSNGSNNSGAYSLTVAANNELNQTETTDIQDTKWRLRPVGVRTDWPYNQMPLRVEVKKGGVDKNGAEDKYYYGSLCVPFDSRLGNTTDAAFTMVREMTGTSGTITMPSVSQYNGMGNPQYVPATWPVVIRTNKAGNWSEGGKHYVDMYLPYTTPQNVSKADLNDKLKGEYLEKTLTGVDDKTIMVFGLPFASHATDHHVYDDTKRVGWFKNDNWARETYATGYNASTATDAQRNNKYVMHNKVYYVLTPSGSSRDYVIALFDDEEPEDDKPIQESVGNRNTPWPCRVYDLQGRLISERESPETLLINHPSLQPGVYIFGDRKVIVK